jgi:hypothetical protein
MPPLAPPVERTLLPQLFGSGDSCGDWIVAWGPEQHLQLQVANTLSSLLYLLAGAQVFACAETALARSFGLASCSIALGAVGVHATVRAALGRLRALSVFL